MSEYNNSWPAPGPELDAMISAYEAPNLTVDISGLFAGDTPLKPADIITALEARAKEARDPFQAGAFQHMARCMFLAVVPPPQRPDGDTVIF